MFDFVNIPKCERYGQPGQLILTNLTSERVRLKVEIFFETLQVLFVQQFSGIKKYFLEFNRNSSNVFFMFFPVKVLRIFLYLFELLPVVRPTKCLSFFIKSVPSKKRVAFVVF